MENASKALVIAGAILVSILIIGLGMMIFNNVSGFADTSSVDALAVETYNKDFVTYEGTNVKGTNAKALVNKIIQHNLANSTDSSLWINVAYAASGELKTALDATSNGAKDGDTVGSFNNSIRDNTLKFIKTGYTYTITLGYDKNTGYVCYVGVQKNAN